MTVESPAQAVPDGQPFSIPTRVYWEDTDAGGVVYHAQYVAFLERARSEWMRARGQMQEQLRREHDLVFVVRGMQLDFLRPARLDDLLTVTVQVRQARRASIVFDQAIWRGEERLLAAQVKIAAVSASAFRPVGLDEALYQEFKLLEVPA
ncbi:tol-pal system-associated acyl-CoA thioesterase [Pseudoxanthomonas sp. X-1]|uniref:tol-pal system-associated acyl-CoA thioesterase n=1 Tax=Pseudoxanthomonas sp. X-1 TaxID=2571115 RepID=UPI00110AC208|nr:tol-pal system-associated acyl-CoA thioesterase [Pseudoxanthomonas sp. X-1]TMN25350.1 tol-pal system-associated acyl-CoA thioesterase [Pseudoxanthomonas sp. X-1]UAY73882.1 tol-pal system-associated acyl-CoA thioesterase [Pseudoxanthomonas sp. X-1]